MRRADRRDSNHDNAIHHPRGKRQEPVHPRELQKQLITVRAQRDEAKAQILEKEQLADKNYQLYLEEQQQHQSAITLYQDGQRRYQETLAQYEDTKAEVQTYLTLYDQEKAHRQDLQIKYEAACAESQHYLTLYNDTQVQLKLERRSKAGIKGWETRRKRENERLKQEITEMTLLLRDSLARKESAINNLDELAKRMDRIQNLVNIVDDSCSENPVNLIQKFRRIWQAIQEILSE